MNGHLSAGTSTWLSPWAIPRKACRLIEVPKEEALVRFGFNAMPRNYINVIIRYHQIQTNYKQIKHYFSIFQHIPLVVCFHRSTNNGRTPQRVSTPMALPSSLAFPARSKSGIRSCKEAIAFSGSASTRTILRGGRKQRARPLHRPELHTTVHGKKQRQHRSQTAKAGGQHYNSGARSGTNAPRHTQRHLAAAPAAPAATPASYA